MAAKTDKPNNVAVDRGEPNNPVLRITVDGYEYAVPLSIIPDDEVQKFAQQLSGVMFEMAKNTRNVAVKEWQKEARKLFGVVQ